MGPEQGSRIEGGKQAIDEVDLIHWLSTCNVKSARLRQLVDHNREANKETWVLPHGPASADSRNLVAEEKASKKITVYACGLIPGLLQTPDYARAVISHGHDDEKIINRAVVQRMTRQEILRGERAVKATFFIEEQVSLRPADDPSVIHDQLMHLLFRADWKKISIRVLPTGAGLHSAGQGEFNLIERRDGRSVAWIDTRAAAVVLEADEHVKAYKETIEELATLALGEEESRAYIARLAGGPRGESDDRGGVA